MDMTIRERVKRWSQWVHYESYVHIRLANLQSVGRETAFKQNSLKLNWKFCKINFKCDQSGPRNGGRSYKFWDIVGPTRDPIDRTPSNRKVMKTCKETAIAMTYTRLLYKGDIIHALLIEARWIKGSLTVTWDGRLIGGSVRSSKTMRVYFHLMT